MNLHFISELGKEAMEFKISEIELINKSNVSTKLAPIVLTSLEVYDVLYEHWDKGKIEFIEQFKIVLLNKANRIIGIMEVSSGGTSSTIVDTKLVFVSALKANAHAIILAHNHPSGVVKPSEHDNRLTRKMREIGTLLEIRVLDHLIISNDGYFSYSDEGLI
ncbi:MAG: JAB domain-containing protein [Chitinophagaceae bacterium]|nr:JAB domain-containing protein [Chitinophagaceae bacterium]